MYNARNFVRGKKEGSDRNTNTTPDLEQVIVDALSSAKKSPTFNTSVCVHIHNKRKRLADLDNLSGKAVLDGLVKAQVLPDDRSKYIQGYYHTQTIDREKSNRIVITIESI